MGKDKKETRKSVNLDQVSGGRFNFNQAPREKRFNFDKWDKLMDFSNQKKDPIID